MENFENLERIEVAIEDSEKEITKLKQFYEYTQKGTEAISEELKKRLLKAIETEIGWNEDILDEQKQSLEFYGYSQEDKDNEDFDADFFIKEEKEREFIETLQENNIKIDELKEMKADLFRKYKYACNE